MGASNSDQQKRIYYTLFGGKMSRKCEPNAPNVVTRQNKKLVTVHEQHFDTLEGKLTSVTTKDGGEVHGMQWVITLNDGGEESVLQLKYSCRQSQSFLKRLPNVDLSEPIKIKTFAQEEVKNGETIKVTVLFITQGQTSEGKDKTVPAFYTKNDPNGLPQMTFTEEKKAGKVTKVWSDTAMMDFLEDMVAKKIMPKIKAIHSDGEIIKPVDAAPLDKKDEAEEQPAGMFTEDESSDLPF